MMLREEIEQSFGTGPGHPPVEDRVKAGHRALLRRRAGAALGAVGVVAVLGATYAVVSPDSPDRPGTAVAVDPTPTPSPTADAEPWDGYSPARYLNGELQIRPDAVVHEHIENPFGYESPDRSDALDVTVDGERIWSILSMAEGTPTYAATGPSRGGESFADWVADRVARQVGGGVDGNDWPRTLRLTDDGRVVASEGSEILQRTDDPQLGDNFAAPGTPTGAALVRAAEDGVGYFVVWRVVDGMLDVITVPPADVVGATFQELLTYARAQYAAEVGLR